MSIFIRQRQKLQYNRPTIQNNKTRKGFNNAKQEAQLPHRNRASATYFFAAKLISIAHSRLYNHPKSLRPIIRLICYAQRIHFSIQCYRRAHDARPHCRLKFLFSGTAANTHIIFILPETRVSDLHEGCCAIGVSVFTLTQ